MLGSHPTIPSTHPTLRVRFKVKRVSPFLFLIFCSFLVVSLFETPSQSPVHVQEISFGLQAHHSRVFPLEPQSAFLHIIPLATSVGTRNEEDDL